MFVDTTPMVGHARIGLQFSGGKDSLALWAVLRPHLHRVVVYHVDTGDQLQETADIVRWVEERTPHFHRIQADSVGFRLREGLVSDIVPATANDLGLMYGMAQVKICGRLFCCFNNQMLPMHETMLEHKVTLAIRGTKAVDAAKLPHHGGKTDVGYDLWLPLHTWSNAQVFNYLREQGIPIHSAYAETKGSLPDCATCTAWWSDERAEYLQRHAPAAAALYRAGLDIIAGEIGPLLRDFQIERGT